MGTDILHHVDLDAYLPLLRNALRVGGRLVFSEPGGLNPAWYVYLPLTAPWHIEKGVRNSTYFNLRRKLEAHGFRDASVSGLGLLPRPSAPVRRSSTPSSTRSSPIDPPFPISFLFSRLCRNTM